jgi:hypothetical protein
MWIDRQISLSSTSRFLAIAMWSCIAPAQRSEQRPGAAPTAERVRPLERGYGAWRKRGYPPEPADRYSGSEVTPVFSRHMC